MSAGTIEALHIYDEHRNPILSHAYTARPLSAAQLLPLYLAHPPPRPSLIFLPDAFPPTLVFGLVTAADVLLLATASAEVEPLLVLEFLRRVVDALEDFLGAPLLAVRIEASYDVVAQLLTEMCDAGLVATTEPNALREAVEVEGWVGKLLGNLSLPGKPLAPTSPLPPPIAAAGAPALPWRRANVRHTSNEMYADMVESVSVILAPSGRPLAAFANGTIAFTSKISGVPDITLTLTSPGGRHAVAGIVRLPVFHPCVRLARWKENPAELSFIPPDGRCVLAGYEVDLMPAADANPAHNPLKLPVTLEVRTGLGPAGSDFDVRLQVNQVGGGQSGGGLGGLGGGGGGGGPANSASPSLDGLVVSVPLPAEVRSLPDVRPSKGDASYNPADRVLTWHIPTKALTPTSRFSLRCTVVGAPGRGGAGAGSGGAGEGDEEDEEAVGEVGETGEGREAIATAAAAIPGSAGLGFGRLGYDEPYQGRAAPAASSLDGPAGGKHDSAGAAAADKDRDEKRAAQNRMFMPTSAAVSFSVKGWLASGLKVESILINTRKSRGLGEGVKPYKGVKYLTVSRGGVELRC